MLDLFLLLLLLLCRNNDHYYYYLTYLTVPAIAVAGFRLRNAFNHFVFIDELDVDSLRSLRGGDPRSAFPKKSSFCE